MKRGEILISLVALALIGLACVGLGITSYVPPGELQGQFQAVFNTFTSAAKLVIIAAALALTVGAAAGLMWLGWIAYHSGVIWQSEAEMRRAKAHQARRDATLSITVLPPGSQAIISELLDTGAHLRHVPGHLLASAFNGEYNPTDADRLTWAYWVEKNGVAKPPRITAAEPAQLQPGQTMRPILPLLIDAQRAIIAGPSGTGKTTLLQHLVNERSRFSKVVLIDPHGQRPKYGSLVDAIGCGMRFPEIDEALRSIDLLMVQRYHEIAAGADHRSHANVTLIIDELMAIVDERQRGEAGREAATVIKRLATQARKAAIDVFLIAHSLLVRQTGLKDASDLLANFTVVELHRDLDDTRSCYLHLVRPGGKKELIECALPGPFDESQVVIHPDRILSLPPAPTLEEIKIIDAIRGNPGASFGEIARIIGASNSAHTNRKVRAVIERFGLEGYEIGLKAA